MKRLRNGIILFAVCLAAALVAQSRRSYGPGRVWWEAGRGVVFPIQEDYDDADGLVTILSFSGNVNPSGHAFFESLGTNGRACITCHQPSNAMSLAAAALRQRWAETQGRDAVFAAIDGSNCPDLPQNAMASHSLLLTRGLIRIYLPWPSKNPPDFKLEVVRDPTGCNTSPVYGLNSAQPSVSVYRRPRMVANFKYVPQLNLMTDGREPSLESQAITAALVHEEAKDHPTASQLRQIVDFEQQVFVAQSADDRGGLLNERGGPIALGPENLAAGKAPRFSGEVALPASFDLWKNPSAAGVQLNFRASVARGNELFAERCATCHAAGSTRALDIGTTTQPYAREAADLPLFRVTCNADGKVIYTQDPGRALITGKCSDVGAIVMQQLRGLAARAPYFSNGSAATLREVVEFYDRRYAIGYSEQQKQDLVNFLRSL
jgi:mono/diheme cytochrome c family protein